MSYWSIIYNTVSVAHIPLLHGCLQLIIHLLMLLLNLNTTACPSNAAEALPTGPPPVWYQTYPHLSPWSHSSCDMALPPHPD